MTEQLLEVPIAARHHQRALRSVWRVLNAESRGKITTAQALGAILHICMKAMKGQYVNTASDAEGGT